VHTNFPALAKDSWKSVEESQNWVDKDHVENTPVKTAGQRLDKAKSRLTKKLRKVKDFNWLLWPTAKWRSKKVEK
jgi:hypothetical protein